MTGETSQFALTDPGHRHSKNASGRSWRMEHAHKAGLIILVFLTATVCVYLVAWRGKRSWLRRGASLIFASISAVVGFVGTAGYAVPALDDFRNPAVPFAKALLGDLILWAICASVWIIAVRCALFALRNGRSGQSLP
jgi:hypothetical protein